jgi:putative endonuclease
VRQVQAAAEADFQHLSAGPGQESPALLCDRRPVQEEVTQPGEKDLRIEAHGNLAWLVYILLCADGTLYTGVTTDLTRRCRQHQAGTASRYTRGRRPTRLIYQETHASRSLALRREAAIKTLSRRAKEELIRRDRVAAKEHFQ